MVRLMDRKGTLEGNITHKSKYRPTSAFMVLPSPVNAHTHLSMKKRLDDHLYIFPSHMLLALILAARNPPSQSAS